MAHHMAHQLGDDRPWNEDTKKQPWWTAVDLVFVHEELINIE
ncbi:hypothetical protein [Oculatella sp. LEGE 06141]